MPDGLTIGSGIARGARAFVQSFMAAKQMEQQEKLQKNNFIVQILTRQLEDENLPYYERAKIMDSIPQLLGVKNLERPLSQMMGLDKFNEQTVEDPNQPAVKGQKGKAPSSVSGEGYSGGEQGDLSTTGMDFSQTSVNLKGTQATQDIAAGMTQQGNLSPAMLKKKLLLEIDKAKDAGDIEKQTKLFEVQYQLQRDILGKGGYNKVLDGYYDEDKNYYMQAMNSEGEIKTTKLGKGITPARLAEVQARVQATANKPSTFVRDRIAFHKSQGLDDQAAAEQAYKDLDERDTARLEATRASTQSTVLGNTGQKPPTASAILSDEDRDRGVRLQLQGEIDNNQAEVMAAKNEVDRLGKAKSDKHLERSQIDKQLADEDLSDEQRKDLERKKAALTTDIDQLEKQFGEEVRKEQLAKEKLKGAQRRLSEVQRSAINTGAKSNFTGQVKSAIDKVRENNPQQTSNMTDQQIYDYLKSKGKIK